MSSIDTKVVNTIRVICAEAIQKSNSGHPGICLGSAPIGYTLYNDFLTFNPANPKFVNRDRFVLSAGHGSMLLYTLLHLFGYNVTMEDLQNFRQFGSKAAGHPEYGVTDGVEVSTGPLGQGIANAVGMAMAEKHLAAHFNRKGYNVVDHYTYALCGDGCNMEGIGYEAVSLAGTLQLDKLIVLYDKNNITIEGNTDIAFTEDVSARYEAMGWQVLHVADGNNLQQIRDAISCAKQEHSKPSLVVINTVIGYGSPNQGTAGVHGAPLGEDNIAKLRANLNYTQAPFTVANDVAEHCNKAVIRGQKAERDWNELFQEYSKAYPQLAEEFNAWQSGHFDGVWDKLNEIVFDKPEATRNTGNKCLNAVAEVIPSLFGGSADLAPSNKTNMAKREYFSATDAEGSNVHFGIREHAMSAICNGIACHGGLRPYCSTFFVFSDYMKNGMRMSAMMNLPVTYILTHDSIGVGEDGPTHEPVEQLVALRSTPNFKVYRPADGYETKIAYKDAFCGNSPCAIVLSRQNLPQLPINENAVKGGYVVDNGIKQVPDVILIASGSEVQLALQAQAKLAEQNIGARVVSMPCMEVYESQSDDYKQSVLPNGIRARVCIEAGSSYSWYKYAGLDGELVTIDTFGASAPYSVLFEKFGFTVQNVVDKALKVLSK